MFEPVAILVSVAICMPAILMALNRSPWLVDYLFFVVALNRGIRRYVDFQNGYFNPLSFISLTPIIVGGLATLVVLAELNDRSSRFGSSTFTVLFRYGIAVAFAFVVGFLSVKQAAIYALGEYIAPIGLIGFAALNSSRTDILNRWCNSMALSAVLVATYGLYQFYTIPPWDAFWVRAVNFEGYLGTLEPTKMSLFSTMPERGPCATYLCGGLILLLLRPGTLSIFRFPAAAVVLYAMLLTYSRTTVIQASLACILFPLINRGAGALPVIVLCVGAALFGESLLSAMPGSNFAAQRVSTIGNIQDDGSFRGRIQLFSWAAEASLTEPLGVGIGSHGMANRIASTELSGLSDSTGYVETLRTFGWVGFCLIVSVLFRCWRASSLLLTADLADSNVNLFRAWFASGLVALFSGSWMFTATFFWVLAGYCLGFQDELEEQETNLTDSAAESVAPDLSAASK